MFPELKKDAHAGHEDFRFGYVALIGPPNAGKSTLLNRIIGRKITITSRKPQTTRHRILGVKTLDDAQIVFVDTPGIHDDERKTLNRVINKTAVNSMMGVDLVLLMIDARGWGEAEQWVLQLVAERGVPVFLVINKVDRLRDKAALLPLIDESRKRYDFRQIVPVSARKGDNVDHLLALVSKAMPEGGLGFPPEQITDRSQRFLAAELVREQLFGVLGQELPYATAVEMNDFGLNDKGVLVMDMTIWVEKPGQKAIVIGKQGETLKRIGQRARKQMERLFGAKVYLSLWVKVRKGWADNASVLKSLGYIEE